MKKDPLDNHIDKQSAAPTIAGFDFQFYSFIYLLFKIDTKGTIQYETEDDILVVDKDGKRTLIQAKHTIQEGTTLTRLDMDFWKTVDNWLKLYYLSNNSKSFFIDTNFQLWINRPVGDSDFYEGIENFKNDSCTLDEIRDILTIISSNIANIEIQEIIKKLLDLGRDNLARFIRRISFIVIEGTEILDKIKIEELEENRGYCKTVVNNIYSAIIAIYKENNYFKTIKRERIILNGLDIKKKLANILSQYHNNEYVIDRTIEFISNDSNRTHICIQQLEDIRYLNANEEERVYEILEKKFKAYNTFVDLVINHEFSYSDFVNIDADAKRKWQHHFSLTTAELKEKEAEGVQITNVEINSQARNCFAKTVASKIKNCDLDLSTGYFYHLSDRPKIGWRLDWENKYKMSHE